MKNVRTKMEQWFDRLDERWRSLPVGRQHRYMLCFFAGYLLLTLGVIFKVWYDTARPDDKMVIRHIEKPVLKNEESPADLQDTIVTILKNKTYERK
ncbi:MAG: nitrogen regulatory IIA protein [Sediminibacterium sp.]